MNGKVISNKRLNAKFGYMEVKCPKIAEDKSAGRFFMVSVHPVGYNSFDPLLKRPFAVCDVMDSEHFSFLYMVCGRGTDMLTQVKEGQELSFTGPLGNYFKLAKNSDVALVGGGVGIAPMVITAKRLKELGSKVTLFYGGRSKDDILMIDKLQNICDEFVPVTEDGTLGIKGLVTVPLKERIGEFKKIYACGPNIMLKFVTGICVDAGVKIEVSLDEQMCCGVGACLGCLIPLKINGEQADKRCCVEGPIFDGASVDWARLIR